MMKNIFIFLFSVLFLNLSVSANEEPWKLEKDKDGIKIWNRKTTVSSLKEYKVTTILQTTPEKLNAFLKNVSLYEKWMFKVNPGSVKVLKRNSENDYYTYMTISAPFIKMRESITHMVFNPQDSKGVIMITMEAAPDLLPKNDNCVRIPMMKGYFKIVPLGNGNVELTHQALSSPGGSIPDFLVNMGAIDCPFYMFSKLKTLL